MKATVSQERLGMLGCTSPLGRPVPRGQHGLQGLGSLASRPQEALSSELLAWDQGGSGLLREGLPCPVTDRGTVQAGISGRRPVSPGMIQV